MQLRNCILIALAFDATEDEIAQAHDMLDRVAGGADPTVLVSASVNGTTGALETSGTGQAITPATAAAGAAASGNVAAPSNAQLDAAGFPWDERIHSSNKKLNDKGLWWAKRGVTPAMKASVEAELRATLGAAPQTAAPANPAPAPQTTAQVAPPMPGANLPPMPGAAQPDPAYTNLVTFIAQNTQSSANPNAKFTDQYIKDVLTHYGVAEGSLQNLAHRLDLVPTVEAWLRQVLAS